MTSNSIKYYLIDGVYRWCKKYDLTAHILVDTSQDGVLVPTEFIEDNRVVLNISDEATIELKLDEEAVDFMTNFNHRVTKVCVPIESILAIYAYENGEGITFGDEDGDGESSFCFPEADIDVCDSDNDTIADVIKLKKPVLTLLK